MASDAIRDVTDAEFDAVVAEGTTLVDFWAPWCGPCRMQTPILYDIAQTVGDRVTVVKVNVDQHIEAAALYGVRSIPTLLVLRDGQEVERFVGVQPKEVLLHALDTHAPTAK